jgi:hypothetical protein
MNWVFLKVHCVKHWFDEIEWLLNNGLIVGRLPLLKEI